MPKRINLEPHFSAEEFFNFYRQASDPIERTRYQIIWLLAQGRLTEDVAKVTGYCRNSIYRLGATLLVRGGVELRQVLEEVEG